MLGEEAGKGPSSFPVGGDGKALRTRVTWVDGVWQGWGPRGSVALEAGAEVGGKLQGGPGSLGTAVVGTPGPRRAPAEVGTSCAQGCRAWAADGVLLLPGEVPGCRGAPDGFLRLRAKQVGVSQTLSTNGTLPTSHHIL